MISSFVFNLQLQIPSQHFAPNAALETRNLMMNLKNNFHKHKNHEYA